MGLGQFGRYLGFESETIFAKIEILEQRRAENFVARLHVGEVEIREHVGKQRQESIAHHVPEIKNAVRPASEKTRTEYHVGISRKNGREENRIFGGIILKVRILYQNDVAGGDGKTSPQRGALSLIARLVKDAVRALSHLFLQNVDRSISRSIINDYDFDILDRCSADCIDDLLDGPTLVKTRYDDRDFHPFGNAIVDLGAGINKILHRAGIEPATQ